MSTILSILNPIYVAVSWVLVAFHKVFTTIGLPGDSGAAWALSIVGLVVVIRIILIPLFVKQIKAQRGLQALQPQMKEIQKKYKNDRERQSQELMKLYRETGTNPLSSCLPLIAQSPIFFGLFHVLDQISRDPSNPPGVFTVALANSASHATLFGAPLSDTFLGATETGAKTVIAVMVLLMTATMFLTQRQLMSKNMPASATGGDNPFAQQQRILLYVMPGIFLVSGLGFPIGVLLYWLTTNVWTMGQQFYVIRNNPMPGTKAYEEWERRRAEKGLEASSRRRPVLTGKGDGEDDGEDDDGAGTAEPSTDGPKGPGTGGQRQQPKRQSRGKRSNRPQQPGPRQGGEKSGGDSGSDNQRDSA